MKTMLVPYGRRLLAITLLLPITGHAQGSPPAQDYKSPAVLRATTRLVVVDVVATDSKGSPVKKEISSLSGALKPADFEKLMQGYFRCKRTIDLKPGHYNLTLGVVDQSSSLIGTTTASVSVP